MQIIPAEVARLKILIRLVDLLLTGRENLMHDLAEPAPVIVVWHEHDAFAAGHDILRHGEGRTGAVYGGAALQEVRDDARGVEEDPVGAANLECEPADLLLHCHLRLKRYFRSGWDGQNSHLTVLLRQILSPRALLRRRHLERIADYWQPARYQRRQLVLRHADLVADDILHQI